MSDAVRGFPPGDVMARGIDPTRFKSKSSNSCWPKPPPAPARPPAPVACARIRCTATATTDDGPWCDRHAAEEREWQLLDAEQVRRDKEQRMGYRR